MKRVEFSQPPLALATCGRRLRLMEQLVRHDVFGKLGVRWSSRDPLRAAAGHAGLRSHDRPRCCARGGNDDPPKFHLHHGRRGHIGAETTCSPAPAGGSARPT